MREGTCRAFVAALLMLAAAGATRAQDGVSEDIVDATIGQWLIASSDGSLGCRVKLEKGQTIGGRVITEESPCGPPWHDVIAAWEFSGPGIVVRDATRKEIIGFEEQEGGPWRTPLDVSPTVYFIPEPGKMDHVPAEKEAFGAWVLTDKKGKALCRMKLLDTASRTYDEAKVIELAKDCDAAVRKTKISAWQIAEIQLVMIGGEDWVYAMIPDGDGFITDDGKYRLKRDR